MFLYNILLNLVYLLLYPLLTLRFKGKERKERTGRINLDYSGVTWIHAASVGEVNAVKPLVKELLTKYPSRHFIFSTMTTTGQQAAKTISPKLRVIYLPMDFSIPVRKAFKKMKPEMLILVETELWPNLLHQAKRKKIPVIIVNGRISDKSLTSYRRLLFFWKPLWKNVIQVNAQSRLDAERFRILKFQQIENTLNLKFCLKLPDYDRQQLRSEMGFAEDDFVLVWGSSRPGEEKLFKEAILELRGQIPNLKAILIPRHLSRLAEIKKLYTDLDYTVFSDSSKLNSVTIVDEMNILPMFYAVSDTSIVGGSFFNFGGHNPLEPACYGVPIIMGKYHNDCRDSVNKLIEDKAIVISDKKELIKDILELYKNPESAKKLGNNAKLTLTKNSESLKRNLEILERLM